MTEVKNKKQVLPLSPPHTHTAAALGYCMYCGRKEVKLSKEHIIPYWLAGHITLPESSCEDCADITKKFEADLSYTAFMGLRTRINLQSRSRKKRMEPPIFEVKQRVNGQDIVRQVSADQMPPTFATWDFKQPGIISGRDPGEDITGFKIRITNLTKMIESKGIVHGTYRFKSNPFNHMRLAAKIAHGYLHAEPEALKRYEPLLNDVILTGNFAPYYVGGYEGENIEPKPTDDGQVLINKIDFKVSTFKRDKVHEYLIVKMHLLPHFGGPKFMVVAGRRQLQAPNVLADQSFITLPVSNGVEIDPPPVFLGFTSIG